MLPAHVPDKIKLRMLPADEIAKATVIDAGYKCLLDLTMKVRRVYQSLHF